MRLIDGTGDSLLDKPATWFRARAPAKWFWTISGSLALVLLVGHTQLLTGDEPRYFLYARALLEHGSFEMGLPEWQALFLSATRTTTAALPIDDRASIVMNAVYLPALLSPVAWAFSLRGLRAVTLLAGIAGLHALYRLCRRAMPAPAALAAIAAAGCCIPLLPYLHIFYMETFLFALVCVTWERLLRGPRSAAGDVVTALLLIAIPFVQLRGAVVAAALLAWLIWRSWAAGKRRRTLGLMLLALAGLGALVALNLAIYGAVTGPVNTARPPWPWQWFGVLSMQLFNVRHGLLAYAPVWLLGYAGLILGAWRGSVIARQGLVLAAIAAATGVGVNPGECWPARFWVLSVPMLAVGFGVWVAAARGWMLRAATLALLAMTLLNSAMFIWAPNEFIENRQASNTYQLIFDAIGFANPGLMLPVEDDAPADTAESADLTIAAAVLVALLVAAASGWQASAALALLMVAAMLDLTRVEAVPAGSYSVAAEPSGFRVLLRAPVRIGYVKVGNGKQAWFAPPIWPRFAVSVDGAPVRVVPANPVIAFAWPAGATESRCRQPVTRWTWRGRCGSDWWYTGRYRGCGRCGGNSLADTFGQRPGVRGGHLTDVSYWFQLRLNTVVHEGCERPLSPSVSW